MMIFVGNKDQVLKLELKKDIEWNKFPDGFPNLFVQVSNL